MASPQWYDGQQQRLRRLAAGMDQRALAERADVGQPLISKVEKGHVQPSPANAARIAAALGCKIADLMVVRPAAPEQVA